MTSLRILIVGYFRPLMYYGILQKLAHGFVRLGHNVHTYDERQNARRLGFGVRQIGRRRMNREFLEVAQNLRPHAILFGHAEMITNATLLRLREVLPETRLLYRNVDALFVPDNIVKIHRWAQYMDAVFITTAGPLLNQFAGARAKIYFMPNCVDQAIEPNRAFASADQAYDVFYGIGGAFPGDTRPAFINGVMAACPNVRFCLRGIPGHPGYTNGAHYMNLLANVKMGINHSRQNDHYLYSSDRMVQYLGNGLLTFVEKSTGFMDIFTEDEIAFYENTEELSDKIRHYAAHETERQRVAKNGWEKASALFASERVGQYILERGMDTPLSQTYGWPVEAAKA